MQFLHEVFRNVAINTFSKAGSECIGRLDESNPRMELSFTAQPASNTHRHLRPSVMGNLAAQGMRMRRSDRQSCEHHVLEEHSGGDPWWEQSDPWAPYGVGDDGWRADQFAKGREKGQ